MSQQSYFLCGVGGSGMASLARLLLADGCAVSGSDRAHDQGRSPEKFARLQRLGVSLHPQDGSGVRGGGEIVVASAAVEDAVPDIAAAKKLGATILTRAALLAALFNARPNSVAIGGTSGKSTTTAMIATVLHAAGLDPSVMNGAVMKNFATLADPDASAVAGAGPFVSEVDESDGSIAKFAPRVAVLNNVSLDHKSMEELRALFGDFVAKAEAAVINLDDPEAAALAPRVAPGRLIGFSLTDPAADVFAADIALGPDWATFTLHERTRGAGVAVRLATPGRHNIANALAASGAARALGVDLETIADGLARFQGVKRRFDIVGRTRGITVIDDFAHNPDKIAATLAALKAFPGRLLVMWQPHGFGPLRLMRAELADAFAQGLDADDLLILPEPVYFGGTVDRSVTSADLAADIRALGRAADVYPDRAACGDRLAMEAREGDRIVTMGARDDTLSDFAAAVLERLG